MVSFRMRDRLLADAHELADRRPGVLAQGLVAVGVVRLAGLPEELQLLPLLAQQARYRPQLLQPLAVFLAQLDLLEPLELLVQRVDQREDRVEDVASVLFGVSAGLLAVGDEADVQIGLKVMGGGQAANRFQELIALLR